MEISLQEYYIKHHLYILMLSLALSLTACHSDNTESSGGSANRSPQIPLIPATIPQIPLTPTKPAVKALVMLGGDQTLALGTTIKLFAAVKFTNDHIKTVTDSVTWVSSDPSVATISATGLVIGLKPGKTIIGALYSNIPSNTQELVVSPITSIHIISGDHGVQIKGASFQLPVRAKKQLLIIATLADKTTTDITNLTDKIKWTTQDKKIATVDKNGLITAVTPGTTLISASLTLGSQYYAYASKTLQVIEKYYFGENAIYGNVDNGTAIKVPSHLVCLTTYRTGILVDVTKYAQWDSSYPEVASVDSQGIVTWHKPGNTEIHCRWATDVSSYETKFQSKQLTGIELHQGNQLIKNMPSGPILNNTTQTIALVTSINYPFDINAQGISKNAFYPTAWAVYKDGTKENITKYTSWWSSDQKSVYLNYLKGSYLFGRKPAQNVLITASYAGQSASFTVDVKDEQADVLSSIQIFLSDGTEIDKNISRKINTHVRLIAIGNYGHGLTKDISSNVRYLANDPMHATVLNDLIPNVLYIGWRAGTTTMTASWQGIQKTFTVTAKAFTVTAK